MILVVAETRRPEWKPTIHVAAAVQMAATDIRPGAKLDGLVVDEPVAVLAVLLRTGRK